MALRELVEGMHDLIERSLGPTIEVRIEIPERLPAVVVDPHQFELAILNLAVNARDAMGEGGRLEIGARTDLVIDGAVDGLGAGRYVCLEVADNGGACPPRCWPAAWSRSFPPRAWARAPASACRWSRAWSPSPAAAWASTRRSARGPG